MNVNTRSRSRLPIGNRERERVTVNVNGNVALGFRSRLPTLVQCARVLVHSSSCQLMLCVYSVELVFRLLLPSHVVTVFCDVHVDS